MRYHILVNPAAGRHRALPVAQGLGEALRAGGHTVSLYVTTRAGDAAAHCAGLGQGALDRLVVVGGDGTLREVVAGCEGHPPWPIGLVPMGTANLVGRELRMHGARHGDRAARLLAEAREWPADAIRMTRAGGRVQWALANVGAGFDAEIVAHIARLRAAGGRGGYARWVRPIWHTLAHAPSARVLVTVDQRTTYLAAGVVVQNAFNYGGVFALAPDAALDSGQLNVVLMRGHAPRDRFRLLWRMALGGLANDRGVHMVKAMHVQLQATAPVPVQADGDPAGSTDLQVELVRSAVTLLRAVRRREE